jgi:exodeoxyribonuclease VII small subunit
MPGENKTESVDAMKDKSFEVAMAELEELVTKMEQGDLPLDDSLKLFEEGVALTRYCQETLKQAEQKVKMLMADGSDADFAELENE